MTTDIVKRDEVEVTIVDRSPAGMMQAAMANGSSMENIEKMMELQERWEANEARKAYFAAVAEFKKVPVKILKNKNVSFESKNTQSTTSYSHATLGNVAELIGVELSKHDLSTSWKTAQDQAGVTVTCTLTHSMGHCESTSLTAPPDNSGKKNNIQAIGSTVSYLQRYTLLAITGQATHDQDDDGIASEAQCIDGKQVSQIVDMLNSKNVIHGPFFEFLGVKCVEDIPLSRFKEVVRILDQTEVQA